MGDAARYEHDCPECTFLGRFEARDLYFCSQGSHPTLIAREGSLGHQYTTMPLWCGTDLLATLEGKPDFEGYVAVFREALKRAKEKGLVAE